MAPSISPLIQLAAAAARNSSSTTARRNPVVGLFVLEKKWRLVYSITGKEVEALTDITHHANFKLDISPPAAETRRRRPRNCDSNNTYYIYSVTNKATV